MRIHVQSRSGLTLIELSVTSALVGVLGLIIYSLLNIGAILGAKNTAVNTAHQQARVAMLQMIQDMHAAISLPYLIDVDTNGNVVLGANGDEIGPRLGVIVPLQADGSPVMPFPVIGHGCAPTFQRAYLPTC